jgi:hypothetical protein
VTKFILEDILEDAVVFDSGLAADGVGDLPSDCVVGLHRLAALSGNGSVRRSRVCCRRVGACGGVRVCACVRMCMCLTRTHTPRLLSPHPPHLSRFKLFAAYRMRPVGGGDEGGADLRSLCRRMVAINFAVLLPLTVRCAFFNRNLHSRMPLVPPPARLNKARACDQKDASRDFPFLPVDTV